MIFLFLLQNEVCAVHSHDNCRHLKMSRLEVVIHELESARDQATARFASEANMPVRDFLRHFRVVLEAPLGPKTDSVEFRVEPRE